MPIFPGFKFIWKLLKDEPEGWMLPIFPEIENIWEFLEVGLEGWSWGWGA